MTIDERLERLTGRHEALAQTVELIAGMQREIAQRSAENEKRLGQLMDAMTHLVNIVEAHENRLDGLEGQ